MSARPALACLLAAILLAGCGGDAEVAAPAAPAVPAAAAPAVAAAPDPGVVAGKAVEAINLVAADLPGLVEQPAVASTIAQDLAEERAQACVQAPAKELRVTEVPGATFMRPESGDTVASEVLVLRDPATAQKELATLDHPKVGTCLGNFFAEILALASGGVITMASSSAAPLDVADAAGVATRGRRLEATVNAPRGQVRLYIDVVGLQHKSTVVSVALLTNGEPASRAERDRLVGLLSQRMASSAV